MLNIVLVEPETPRTQGERGAHVRLYRRATASGGADGLRRHARNLARAGCDYWDDVDIVRWSCADEFFEAHAANELHLFTGHVQRSFADVSYGPDAWLVFGRESRGLDEAVMQRFESACVRIPMRDGMRSLNLSNSGCNSRIRGFAPAKLARLGLSGDF